MKLYDSLADWWPLLSPPSEYAEESAVYAKYLDAAATQPARTMVEFGSGGGNNASYLKKQFDMTLVDLSAGMLAVSRRLNPECEHIQGDMRSIRLQRQFDRVFIHDAICYMTSAEDLRRAVETAFAHCRPGGAAAFVPDYFRETFRVGTDHGGCDGDNGGLRYLEWVWDPDPTDSTYIADYAYLLREEDGSVSVEHDRHVEGLFSRAEWLAILKDAGFEPAIVPLEPAEAEEALNLLIGVKP
ncbi:MAG TPA: class I SAM-dependent methyltransferase [Bryobacteraceae bacterium]|nr:class I SAM-dependent methyltransferase [Bryobacteraceae bacterium]